MEVHQREQRVRFGAGANKVLGQKRGQPNSLVLQASVCLAGIAQKDGGAAGWIPYAQVDDVDAATKKAQRLGATIMNGRCLRVGKEFLALVDYKGSGLVVKLSQKRVKELVAKGVAEPFAPAGRVFKEWVSVPKPDRRRWRSLLQEGVVLRLVTEKH